MLLITVGGGAAGGAATTIVRASVRFASRYAMHVMILAGPGTVANPCIDRARMEYPSTSIEVISNPSDIPALMAAADLAVSAAGSTTWQLCCMGVPSLLVTMANNQDGIAASLQSVGCAVDLGWYPDLTEARILDALEGVYINKSLRDEMSRRGRSLVDGSGAERVAAALLARMKIEHEAV